MSSTVICPLNSWGMGGFQLPDCKKVLKLHIGRNVGARHCFNVSLKIFSRNSLNLKGKQFWKSFNCSGPNALTKAKECPTIEKTPACSNQIWVALIVSHLNKSYFLTF